LFGVEVRRLALRIEGQAVDRVSAIDAARRRLDVRAARTDGQVLERPVRAVETNRVPIEEVIVADDEAVVVEGPGGEVERRAFGPAGCRNSVIPDAACFVDLLRMVVGG